MTGVAMFLQNKVYTSLLWKETLQLWTQSLAGKQFITEIIN